MPLIWLDLKLLLNAEGTRFTEKKHEACIQFARERGITELKYHLIPRTKGFTASLKPLKAKCHSVLDIQLAFKQNDKTEPTVGNLLHGRGVTGYMYVQRIDMKDVPADETAAAEWMQELFRRKDRLQDSFHTHGDFFTGTGLKPIEPFVYSPTIGTIGNTIFWSIVTVTPIVYYLIKLLFSGELLYFSLGLAIILVCEYFISVILKARLTNDLFISLFSSLLFDAENYWNVEDKQGVVVWRKINVIINMSGARANQCCYFIEWMHFNSNIRTDWIRV